MNSCRSNPEMSLIFSLLLCQSIPAAAKKLTIWKASAYRYDKLRNLRTAKMHENWKGKIKPEKSELHYLQDSQFKIEQRKFFEPKIVTSLKIDAVLQFTRYTEMKPYPFENAPLLAAFSCGLDRCRVNRMHNRIKNVAVTNENGFV